MLKKWSFCAPCLFYISLLGQPKNLEGQREVPLRQCAQPGAAVGRERPSAGRRRPEGVSGSASRPREPPAGPRVLRAAPGAGRGRSRLRSVPGARRRRQEAGALGLETGGRRLIVPRGATAGPPPSRGQQRAGGPRARLRRRAVRVESAPGRFPAGPRLDSAPAVCSAPRAGCGAGAGRGRRGALAAEGKAGGGRGPGLRARRRGARGCRRARPLRLRRRRAGNGRPAAPGPRPPPRGVGCSLPAVPGAWPRPRDAAGRGAARRARWRGGPPGGKPARRAVEPPAGPAPAAFQQRRLLSADESASG